MNAYAILLCGGSGTRMGAPQNKTLLKVGGVPACVRAFRTLSACVQGVVVVVRAGEEAAFAQAFDDFSVVPFKMVEGGQDRQASVYAGLCALPSACDAVLVHDGARPLVTKETVLLVLDSIEKTGTGVAAVAVRDTIKRAAQDGQVLETLKRDELYAMQTPQGFQKDLLLRAHKEATTRATDDAALVEALGVPVHLVKSGVENIKLTSREDVQMANALCSALPRVGQGIDAHRLVEGRKLILCGVEIPYEKGLLGHSDADVALHALMDALLGAAALGDIGKHFPDTDARYKGISSLLLLENVQALLKAHAITVSNVDVTIVAQAPKLAPYIEQMRTNIAKALRLAVSQVSVKATTTEKMGYEGRLEGISAQAVVLIYE